MKKMEALFPAVIIVFVLFILGSGIFYYQYPIAVMRFPYIDGAFLLVMAGWHLWRTLTGRRLVDEGDLENPTTESIGEFVRTALWLLAILPAIWLLGYLIGIPVYLMIYFRAHGQSWGLSLILSGAAMAVTYFVFMRFLGVNLPVMPVGFG